MKTLLLIALTACLFIGCATTKPDAVSGVITYKEYDEEGENCYPANGGLACVKKPAAYWFKVKDSTGKVHTFTVDETTYYLLEVGDHWPQSR
jgi:hypothetical protein